VAKTSPVAGLRDWKVLAVELMAGIPGKTVDKATGWVSLPAAIDPGSKRRGKAPWHAPRAGRRRGGHPSATGWSVFPQPPVFLDFQRKTSTRREK
jgi:hypothetical protein